MNCFGFKFALFLIGQLLFGMLVSPVSANSTVNLVDASLYKDPQNALSMAEQALKNLPATSPDRPHWEAIAADSAIVLELPEQAMPHVRSGLALLSKSELDSELGLRLRTILAATQHRAGNVSDALQTINGVITKLEASGSSSWLLVEALTERADMQSSAGNFRAALADLLKAYALAKPNGNRGTRGDVAGYLGGIYMNMGDYVHAEQYYREAIDSAIKSKEMVTQSIGEFSLAQALLQAGKLTEAEQFYTSSRIHSEQISDEQGVAFANVGLADIALKQKKYDQADRLYGKALSVFVNSQNLNSQAAIALGFAEIAMYRKQYQRGIEQAKKALAITQNTQYFGLELSTHEMLNKLYVAIGDYQSAYEHQVLARKLEKAKLVAARNLTVAGVEERFVSERQRQENKLLQQKNEFNERQLIEQKQRTTIYFAASLLLLILVGFLVRASYKNSKLRDKLSKLALTDVLTGIANRRSAMAIFEQEFIRARRYGFPLSIAMIDLDHFKTINDSLGHDAGDDVLREFCQMVREHLRLTDSFGRWGGEEFIIILPHTTAEDAILIINRIRESMTNLPHKKLRGDMQCTFSGGVAFQLPDDADVNTMLKRADEALYNA
ncbi:MAG: diguanylate cyclase, partial [Arenimonas sp.]|nr:diguanylate cyclase [Arenimonas sp.]